MLYINAMIKISGKLRIFTSLMGTGIYKYSSLYNPILYIFALLLCISLPSKAQVTPVPTIWSVADGNWSSAATWDSGTGSRLPNATDHVQVRHDVDGDMDATVISISLDNSYGTRSRLRVLTGFTIQVTEATNYAISVLGLDANDLRLEVQTGANLSTTNDGPMYFGRECNCANSIRFLVNPGGSFRVGEIYAYYNNGGFSEMTDEITIEGSATTGPVLMQYDNLNGDSNLYAEVIGTGDWTINGDFTMEPRNSGANAGDIYVQVGDQATDAATMHVTGDVVMNLQSGTSDPDDIRLRSYGSSQLTIDGQLQLIHNSNSNDERIEIDLFDNSQITTGSLLLDCAINTLRVNNWIALWGTSRLIVLGDVTFSSYASGGGARRANQIEMADNSIFELRGNVYTTNEGRFYFTGNNSTAWIYITGSIQQTLPNIYAGPTANGNDNSAYTGTYANLYIENTSGSPVLLESPVEIRGSLNLVEGIVESDLTNTFTFLETATTNSGNDIAYIRGPVYKIGTSDMTVPLGDTRWAPLGLQNYSGGDATTILEVEYVNGTPPDNTNLDPSLTRISSVEYWPLQVFSGTVPASVDATLYWTDACASGIDDITVGELMVAYYNGKNATPIWNGSNPGSQSVGGVSEACDPLDGDSEPGNITALVSDLTDATHVTFASNGTLNALPVELLGLYAIVETDRVNLIWETASELNNEKFLIEKSDDEKEDFQTIGTIPGKGTTSEYSKYTFQDDSPSNGITYYRIKQVDYDGSFQYSNIIRVSYNDDGRFYAFPNPAQNMVTLNRTCTLLEVYDTKGVLKHRLFNVKEIDISVFSKGLYILRNQLGKSFKLLVD